MHPARAGAMLLLGLLTLLSSAPALAQEPADGLAADIEIDPFIGLTVGDPVAVRVTITHERGAAARLDDALVELGSMEPAAPQLTALSETQTLIVFQTRAFHTGAFTVALPPIPIQRADGSRTELALDPVLITIGSLLTEDSQPRPLTDPDLLEGERRTLTPWIVAVIGIGLGFIAARAARRWVRRTQPAAHAQTAAAGTAGAAAPVRFALDDTLDTAEQCRQLAAAVRARLSQDWPLPASALTAAEIGPALAAAGAPGVIVLRVTRLLEACDRVQFGGEQPTPERLHGYLQLAEAIWEDGPSA